MPIYLFQSVLYHPGVQVCFALGRMPEGSKSATHSLLNNTPARKKKEHSRVCEKGNKNMKAQTFPEANLWTILHTGHWVWRWSIYDGVCFVFDSLYRCTLESSCQKLEHAENINAPYTLPKWLRKLLPIIWDGGKCEHKPGWKFWED